MSVKGSDRAGHWAAGGGHRCVWEALHARPSGALRWAQVAGSPVALGVAVSREGDGVCTG